MTKNQTTRFNRNSSKREKQKRHGQIISETKCAKKQEKESQEYNLTGKITTNLRRPRIEEFSIHRPGPSKQTLQVETDGQDEFECKSILKPTLNPTGAGAPADR